MRQTGLGTIPLVTTTRQPPWQYLSVMFRGAPPTGLKVPGGFSASPDLGNKMKPATDTFSVERYFDADTYLDEPMAKLCALVRQAVHQHGLEVLGFMMFARVTNEAPGFGVTLSPKVLAAVAAFGVTFDLSVYIG